jgi:Tfp pilus assembly protein PilN
MRAVNLMPADARDRRTAGADGAGGLGAYFLLGGLAALALFVSMWTLTNNQISSRTAEVDRISAEARSAEARAAEAAPYLTFATLSKERTDTVTALSTTRFDWAHGLGEISRVLPADVWLSTLDGASGATGETPSPTTNAAPAPTFKITGCTRSQAKVALLLVRLRAIDRVRKVELTTSAKPDTESAEGCPANKPTDPAFAITISFAVPGAAKGTVDAIGQVVDATAAATATTAAPTAGTTPAAPAAEPAVPCCGSAPWRPSVMRRRTLPRA